LNTVIVLGSINQDYVLTVDHSPTAGETILADELLLMPGGKGANQAIAAARFGATVHLVGCVGDDTTGESLLKHLAGERVDTRFVTRIEGTRSGAAFITLGTNRENSIIVAPGANSAWTAHAVDDAVAVIRRSDVVMAQLEIPLAAVERAAAVVAETPSTRFILNASPPRRLDSTLLERVDVLVVNEHEAAVLAKMSTGVGASFAAHAARSLVEAGSACVIVTCGADGAICAFRRDGAVAAIGVPAPRVDPVDTTGAGDAFAGALAAYLKGDDIAGGPQGVVSAMRFAVAAGSLATTVVGAQGYISRGQVEAFASSMTA
jgi:ribokinase